MAPHYTECHVIVRDDPAAGSYEFAREFGWWASRLGTDTSGEEHRDDLILTTRKPTHDEAVEAVRDIAAKLKAEGFIVTRGKTEVVFFDTKYGDSLGI